MIQSIAFLTYPVSDIKAAPLSYENVFGLKLTNGAGGEWFEYEFGDTTFAISTADQEHPAPVRGVVVAFEASDLDTEVARLRNQGVAIQQEITETPVCRFATVPDPDGSKVLIHKRKTQACPSA